MTFRVGQKVVAFKSAVGCGITRGVSSYSKPAMGEVCTVATINEWAHKTIITLVEHDNSHLTARCGGIYEPGFDAACFRPIVERKSEARFTTGADPSTNQFDNRRKVRKKVTT